MGRPALLGSFGQRQAACPSRGGQSWGSCWADWDPAWQPLHLEKPLCLLGPPLAGGFWPGSVCWCPDLGPQRLTATSAWGSGPTAAPTLGRFRHLPALGSLAWKLGQGHSLPGPPQGPGEWGGAAPSPALTEWGGGQGHTVSSDSASCWGSHACYTGKLKQKTCRAWSQPAETQRASCELQRSPRPSMRRNLKHQLASPPISRGGN